MSEEMFELTELALDRVDLVTAGANPGAKILIHKFEAAPSVEAPDVQPQEVIVNMADETPLEMVAKADLEAVQKQLDDLAAVAKAAEDRATAAEADAAEKAAEVAKMETEKRAAEYIAKAKELDNIGPADELGARLMEAAEKMSPEGYGWLERTLKAVNAQVEKGALFAQFGKADAEPVDTADRVNALAKAKVEAGEAKTLQIAKLQVLQENRELAAEYSNATRVS
jgi:hypothetical protein